MEGTTNINQLPTDNIYDGNNIVIETNHAVDNNMDTQINGNQQNNLNALPQTQQQMQPQMQQQIQPQMQQQMQPQMQPQQHRPDTPCLNLNSTANDPSMMQHLSSIKQNNLMQSGNMDLPSRDIPTNTNHITQDTQIQPNYVPGGTNFINNQVSQDMINDFNKQQNTINNNNDFLYEQFKIPIIISIIFYIFNQNFVNKQIKSIFPSLFNTDENLKKVVYFLKVSYLDYRIIQLKK